MIWCSPRSNGEVVLLDHLPCAGSGGDVAASHSSNLMINRRRAAQLKVDWHVNLWQACLLSPHVPLAWSWGLQKCKRHASHGIQITGLMRFISRPCSPLVRRSTCGFDRTMNSRVVRYPCFTTWLPWLASTVGFHGADFTSHVVSKPSSHLVYVGVVIWDWEVHFSKFFNTDVAFRGPQFLCRCCYRCCLVAIPFLDSITFYSSDFDA